MSTESFVLYARTRAYSHNDKVQRFREIIVRNAEPAFGNCYHQLQTVWNVAATACDHEQVKQCRAKDQKVNNGLCRQQLGAIV
jgi:hypothetical protein